ncbi:MAG: glycosyltransferase [Chryseobacterium sp.]|uniref:glycosyltransferase n=1 Tax=Chryseobacterium sp. TaxID=1871047 RepID=UPI0025C4F9E0|nr:glycosyltransferase [Chryseobacterium sp.]MCJ7934333.1 glycosyltransferase [Chryseobacterium sp.]
MTSSVALCTYNGENYIAEQLESILSQTKSVSEIVICDDGSTDGTLKILSEYTAQFPNLIKVYQNPENLGYIANFEKAMNLCSGDIVFLCDQDDRWYKDKTEAITSVFEKHPNINIVSHNIKLFGEAISSSEEITYWDIESTDPARFTNTHDIVKRILYQGNIFPGMSMAIRNTFLKAHLPLKKINPVIIHDYELLLLAADKDTVWIEKNILGEYRIHSRQNIGYKTFSQFSPSEKKMISRDSLFTIFKRFPFVKKTIAGLHLNPELENGYKIYCLQRYRAYLKDLPLLERWLAKIKMKYYFHIFDYLK